ncbi:putative nuclease HARBI1 [Epinephelus fuscoguttatus]|uniref:putative nuclease HARBI1 n=1 Tax=Epinephelus fuscoguttatus TaxID=293821 RepID=UPI0020D0E01F|nr:putative nuclease HARBI1 [Epinephelus fuscoguttatus]
MPAVLDGIINMTSRYIRFPYTVGEQANIERQFAAMSGFPNVIVAIDCTQVAIRALSENEFVYVNRKNVRTINVQVMCTSNMVLTNLVARWPGSTHDSFILMHSSVGNRLQAGAARDGWLLGDSGYPLRRWLLTPFTNPQSAKEVCFNVAHSRACSIVERAIGLLKNWCLDASGGRLLYHPTKVCKIIRACGAQRGTEGCHSPPAWSPSMRTPTHNHLPDMRSFNREQGSVKVSCGICNKTARQCQSGPRHFQVRHALGMHWCWTHWCWGQPGLQLRCQDTPCLEPPRHPPLPTLE